MPSRKLLSSDSRPNASVVFLAITISASLIIFFAILYFLYYLWYSLVHRSRTSPFDSSTSFVKLQRFSYKELKSATNGFCESNLIGKGGSGTVYRGILKDGKLVAVKLLDSVSLQGEREFQNELQILGGLRSVSPLVVNLLGYCVDKSRRVVVYEYMPNRSLQESLFSESNLVFLNWAKRFDIVIDVAKALAFLHLECDPPVIHGDVKPSNVLLDSEYRAKLSDFGLSRLKLEVEFEADLFSQELGKSQELWKSQELSGNLGTPVDSHDEVDFALALQASSSTTNSKVSSHPVKNLGLTSLDYNGKGKELSTIENGGEDSSVEHSSNLNLNLNPNAVSIGIKQWGKDWWWRQDGSGELCSKDYVMEWIGSQICESTTPDFDEEKKCSPEETVLDNNAMQLSKAAEKLENKSQETGFDSSDKGVDREGSKRNKKHKKMQEWWKEEHLDVLSKKNDKGNKKIGGIKGKRLCKALHFGLGKRLCFKKRVRQQAEDVGDEEGEFSFRKGWRKKKNARSVNSEMFSGDLFSRELSSTTSMRGTLCYVAPEYGGCGYLMENSDIYSLGVLILVIVSGRRPLHVLSSPMKLERANLISWCRHLALAGNVLEVMDEKLKGDYNKEQASLCIHLALSCLQKVPELRPQIGDIVKILKGDMDLPPLPFEFSPSPPSKLYSRSRRRQKSNPE